MDMGGGGGGGGVIYQASTPVELNAPIPLTVGAGGAGAPAAGTNGQNSGHNFNIPPANGGNSRFDSFIAIGGGGGGSSYWWGSPAPMDGFGFAGGSGGGASGYANATGRAGAGTAGQGNSGGGAGGSYYSGGGGGAGGVGSSGPSQANGGPGVQYPSLSPHYFGGGGGGAAYSLASGGNGGIGGGGGGAVGTTSGGAGINNGSPGGGGCSNCWANTPGGNAGANTGGGGGGGAHYNSNNKGGNGGSGIIILKIPDSYSATFSAGVTQTVSTATAGFKIYTITAAGASDTVTLTGNSGVAAADGLSSSSPANSCLAIQQGGNTTSGTYWITLPTVGVTQVYCFLDSTYDGGGWMMAMKATTGTTFNFDANYWTTANSLNPTQLNRNNGDAKFDSMNYFSAKDIMAIWPDINTGTGGSITGKGVWTWLQNDFNSGNRTTLISFFNLTYPMNNGGSGLFIRDAKTFNGWAAGIFSSQGDIRFYGFNYKSNTAWTGRNIMKVRWGFGWNENGEGLFPSSPNGYAGSNDVSGGIGMDNDSGGGYSAGDRINCCNDTAGINRSARVEIYVR